MYTQTTLQLALLDRSVVYVDGKVHFVSPDPWEGSEEVQRRDRTEQNNHAVALGKPRGRINRVMFAGDQVILAGYSEDRSFGKDTPVTAYEDVIWLTTGPYVGLRNSAYGRVQKVPHSSVSEHVTGPTESYTVLDGKIVRALHRPSTAPGISSLGEGEQGLASGTPDYLSFVNYPVGKSFLLTPGLFLYRLGRFWAESDLARAEKVRFLPTEAGGPSIEF